MATEAACPCLSAAGREGSLTASPPCQEQENLLQPPAARLHERVLSIVQAEGLLRGQ